MNGDQMKNVMRDACRLDFMLHVFYCQSCPGYQFTNGQIYHWNDVHWYTKDEHGEETPEADWRKATCAGTMHPRQIHTNFLCAEGFMLAQAVAQDMPQSWRPGKTP